MCVSVYVYGLCMQSVCVARGHVQWVHAPLAAGMAGAKVPRCETGCLSGARSMSSSVGRKEAVESWEASRGRPERSPEVHGASRPGARAGAVALVPEPALAPGTMSEQVPELRFPHRCSHPPALPVHRTPSCSRLFSPSAQTVGKAGSSLFHPTGEPIKLGVSGQSRI